MVMIKKEPKHLPEAFLIPQSRRLATLQPLSPT
jgi:hypothetical protein